MPGAIGRYKIDVFIHFFHFNQAKRCIATVKTERSQLANGAHGPWRLYALYTVWCKVAEGAFTCEYLCLGDIIWAKPHHLQVHWSRCKAQAVDCRQSYTGSDGYTYRSQWAGKRSSDQLKADTDTLSHHPHQSQTLLRVCTRLSDTQARVLGERMIQ